MKIRVRAGELPQWTPNDKFNCAKWLSGRHADLSNVTNASVPGYRERHARQILAKLDAGKLAPCAMAAVERDYAKELKILRKERQSK